MLSTESASPVMPGFGSTRTCRLIPRDKQHGGGSDARHEQRVMISTTHYGNKPKTVFFAGFREGFYHCGRAIGGGVGVQHLGANWNAAFRRDRLTCGLYLLHHVVTPFEIGIANVGAETNPAGNAVDGAGKNLADADRGYCVDGSAGSRGILDG